MTPLALPAELTRPHVASLAPQLEQALAGSAPIVIDLAAVTAIDSAGAAWLATVARRAQATQRPLQVVGLSAEVARTLALMPFAAAPLGEKRPERAGALERAGTLAASLGSAFVGYLSLCADTATFAVRELLQPRRLHWRAVTYEMAEMGSRALGVVALIAFLVGGTIALQSAAQLRQFGANVFIADLVGISITRELGPLMTAIVVAGRSGAAVAAELATMQVSEEIDALVTMGLNPVRLVVVPKVLAITLMQPLLTAFANAVALLGGFLVAVTYLDVGAPAFINRLQQAVEVRDLATGLVKSIIFANLIVTIGAAMGLATRGGADEVGRSTTRSVVASIFAVIVADAACSLVFYFGA
jgi:phospholipid/cholesterol/gamma-HCH transport system permease protein